MHAQRLGFVGFFLATRPTSADLKIISCSLEDLNFCIILHAQVPSDQGSSPGSLDALEIELLRVSTSGTLAVWGPMVWDSNWVPLS